MKMMVQDASQPSSQFDKRKSAKLWKKSKNKNSKATDKPKLKGILKKDSKYKSGHDDDTSALMQKYADKLKKKSKKSKPSEIEEDQPSEETQNVPRLKRKSEDSTDVPNKKIKLCELKKKDRKVVRKQNDQKNFEIGKNLLKLWEEFRRADCSPERKSQLLKQVCDLLKGRVKEFTFAHDTVRVLECVLANGAESHRTLLFEELKDEIIPLVKAKYGKFFVLKMLRYGTKRQKDAIMKAFHGNVISLIRHKEASEVVEYTFNECANALQRFQLAQEFFGANYKYFKMSDVQSLGEVLEKNPETKSVIIENMKNVLLKVLEKTVVKHSIVHYILLQFMLHSDPNSRGEVIESLRPVVPEILHTKDGSRVAMQCVWHGTLRDRKAIMKSMSLFVAKIAVEEHGHMALLALFDCVDDTKALGKHIIKGLVKNILPLSENVHGKKVLIYLLNRRDPHYIHPDVINILKTGDNNLNSKKDPAVRSSELKALISQPLLELIISNISSLYTDNPFCLFAVNILKHVTDDRTPAFEAIAKLAEEPYTNENKNKHIIEHPGSNFMLKQLILNDRNENEKVEGLCLDEKNSNEKADSSCNDTFSYVLVNTIPSGVMKTWFECNRGAFLLVSLLETKIPEVVEKVKEELTSCRTSLSKKNFKGAEILLKKIKEL